MVGHRSDLLETKNPQNSVEMIRMSSSHGKISIYHITDMTNLPGILSAGGLLSDACMQKRSPTIIGLSHIKTRRLTQIKVVCCHERFVGEFVPFYYCPRSPMLYTINQGNTGKPSGCQTTVIHLVSTIGYAVNLGSEWAISDGNAGSFHANFYSDLSQLSTLDWSAIHANQWTRKTHEKSAEFLVADFFPWAGIIEIGCHDTMVALNVEKMLEGAAHKPVVNVRSAWYY
ncbi:MAG: DUF4433 domain-containing protein [Candidatus Hydrogenedentales bacterium]|jgi:hypothetical protein